MPNGIENISETLERQYILRRFNKDHLKMEESSGSTINRIIGLGTRTDQRTGKTELVTEFYPTYFNHVVKAFEIYPIFKHFGITIKDAMSLPVDQWYRIRKAGRALYENQPPDQESQLFNLLRELVVARQTAED